MRIITLNLNGIRSAFSKGAAEWLTAQNADYICVQELKAQAPDLTPEMQQLDGLTGYFNFAEKKGYSGVALYCRQPPETIVSGIGHAAFDAEGRVIEARYPHLSVVSLYVPSGSSGDERQQIKYEFMAAFSQHLAELMASGRSVVVAGDWNIAHQEIDLKNWRANRNNSGFLAEERAWVSGLLANGWQDVYRQRYPEAGETAYTWWSNRGQAWAKNVGWRLDYQLATPQLASLAQQAEVYKQQRFSDHAPLIIDYADL